MNAPTHRLLNTPVEITNVEFGKSVRNVVLVATQATTFRVKTKVVPGKENA